MDKGIRLQIIYATGCVVISLILTLVGLIMPLSWIKIVICILLASGLITLIFISLIKNKQNKSIKRDAYEKK